MCLRRVNSFWRYSWESRNVVYYGTEDFNIKIELRMCLLRYRWRNFLLRTALAPYWQSLVDLNCACVYCDTLLLHKIEKIKMAGGIREISSKTRIPFPLRSNYFLSKTRIPFYYVSSIKLAFWKRQQI